MVTRNPLDLSKTFKAGDKLTAQEAAYLNRMYGYMRQNAERARKAQAEHEELIAQADKLYTE